MSNPTNIHISIDTSLRRVIDDYAEMGAPDEDVSRCRQGVDALVESIHRLVAWRKQNNLPMPTTWDETSTD